MVRRLSLLPLLLILVTVSIVACSGSGQQPLSAPPAALPDPLPAAAGLLPERPGEPGSAEWGLFALDLDFAEGLAALEPVEPQRAGGAIGDQLAPDISPYLTTSPCRDCLQVKALSLTPAGELNVDLALRHPFPTTAARSDLSAFDTRAIIIMPGTTVFPQSPRIRTGSGDLAVLGNFGLLRNADGYTSHFDDKPADPSYFNPPLSIAGSVNPYRYFFTEDDPRADATGNPIANHRFSQSPAEDVQRFTFALPPDGVTQLRLIVVIEAQYGVSALRNVLAPAPGSRQNPVYFLPAFNQLEAYRAGVTVDGTFTEGIIGQFVQVQVAVEDWQAGMTGSAAYGDLSQPGLIPHTSDVAQVTCEVPNVVSGLLSKTAPDSGSGVQGNPYLYTFTLLNQASAPAGTYTGLISVVDSADGQVSRPTATPGKSIHSFITYQTFRIEVEPNTSGNTPPVAVAAANPNPVVSGQTVNLIDASSYDPDSGDSIVLYEWDYDYSGIFIPDTSSANPNQAATSYTNPGPGNITRTAALRVRDTGNLTHVATVVITITPSGGPSCNATPPLAPTNFAVPTFPTPPYSGASPANRITFTWTAVTGDPCVIGYAIYREDLVTLIPVLINDTNSNGTLEAADAITGTTFADPTLGAAGFRTSRRHYYYRIVTVKNNGAGGVVTSPLGAAPRVYVFFDDFEDPSRTSLFGATGGLRYSGTTSGFVEGLVNNLSYPGGSAFSGYGWDIASNGPHGNANTGTRFADESAHTLNPGWSGPYGPTFHQPYEAAVNWSLAREDGYWNSMGPNLWVDGVTNNPLTGTGFHRMQIYHRYQFETYTSGPSTIAAEGGYVCGLPDNGWGTGTSQFWYYQGLPVVSGKGYELTGGYPPFLDQTYWPLANRIPAQQIPSNMGWFAGGDYGVGGQLTWAPSVFNLAPLVGMVKPIVKFAHTSDQFIQPFQFGWQIDDICIIAY